MNYGNDTFKLLWSLFILHKGFQGSSKINNEVLRLAGCPGTEISQRYTQSELAKQISKFSQF